MSPQLTRSESDRVIAGVAGGIAQRFGSNSTLVRLAWVLSAFFGGLGIVVYLILWIALPKGVAHTPAIRIAEERDSLMHTVHHSDFPPDLLLRRKRESISVVLPAREVADTIGPIIESLRSLDPLIDQILVIDAASKDGTAEVAAGLGAEIHQESELLPEFGQALGKGDAMWRALAVARGELIVYLDSDTRAFSAHFATGMLGPLLCQDGVRFVKGYFRRPFTTPAGEVRPVGGGRVTELTARPLLSAFYPELAPFIQPLAGEVAARRDFFDRLPFATGYAIETSMLLHARDELGGTAGMAQVDLDVRHNYHQPLPQLGPMAYAVLRVVLERLRADGRLLDDHAPPLQTADGQLIQVELVERPPYGSIRARAQLSH